MLDVIQKTSNTFVSNEKEITRLKNIIERHEDKIERIREKNSWCDVILKPIMDAVAEKYPNIKWDYERLNPMGLRCAVSVFGTFKGKDGEDTIMLRFTPSDIVNGLISLDIEPEYSTHGFGSKTMTVTDMDVIFRFIEKRL